nr:type II toxin-antitoxin system VapC family toxin [uncultured Prevotella sp.]
MKQYLLDTNICAFILRDKYDVKSLILEIGIDNCHISLITYAELYYGAVNSTAVEKNLLQLKHFVAGIDVVPIDDVIPVFAKEKVRLRRQGTPIDDFDLLIGTTAKVYGMTLVTENIKHLGKVDGVTIENWINR